MIARIDDPELDVDASSVLVLRNAGPKGGPGMPEWGQLPIPKKLLEEGVRDMLRISDARMSGTSYGACVLHVAPESFVGGPLALLREGDVIRPRCRGAPHRHGGERRGAKKRKANGAPRKASIRAATAGSFSSTSRKRTKVATSTSSKAQRKLPNRRFTDGRP